MTPSSYQNLVYFQDYDTYARNSFSLHVFWSISYEKGRDDIFVPRRKALATREDTRADTSNNVPLMTLTLLF